MATVDDYRFPADRWYDPREHLWVLPEPGEGAPASPPGGGGGQAWSTVVVTIGVDELGAEALGEVVYVELARAGREVGRGEPLGSLEAEKMVRPVLAPVSGMVVDVNEAVVASPRLLNSDPYGGGWLFRLRARAWEAERADLLHGDDAVAAWARAELDRASGQA